MFNKWVIKGLWTLKQENIMGKKPLNENQVKSLRTLVKDKPLHELLLNLSVDLMLRSSDLLSLKVKKI